MSTTRTITTNQPHGWTVEQITFKDLSELWILNKKEKIKQSTYIKYVSLLEHYINSEIGECVVKELETLILDKAMRNIYWRDTAHHLSYSLMKSILFVTNMVKRPSNKRVNVIVMVHFNIFPSFFSFSIK